jgi:iron(III) transport system substrate-binding protein
VRKIISIFLLVALLLVLLTTQSGATHQVVNVYSFRQANLIKPLIDEFTNATGIKVNVVTGKADILMERLINDGNDSFADVLLTVGAARLNKAKELDLIKPINSLELINNVPEQLRDPENFWFGLSLRVRAIFYAKSRVDPSSLKSYEDLIDPRWQGRICSRTGNHFYNITMVSSFIYHYGEKWTRKWVNGFSKNLAMRPNGSDRDQMRKVARGDCDIAIANSYYFGIFSSSVKQSDRDAYHKLGVIFPENSNVGSHINISGAALTKSSKNHINAIKFIEFLTTRKAQEIYTQTNFEFPIRADVPASRLIQSWGTLNADTVSIYQSPKYHVKASKIIQQSNW